MVKKTSKNTGKNSKTKNTKIKTTRAKSTKSKSTKTKSAKANNTKANSTKAKNTKSKSRKKSSSNKNTAKKRLSMPKSLQFLLLMLGLAVTAAVGIYYLGLFPGKKSVAKPEVQEALLSENEYSRSGLPLKDVTGIVVHYVSNPGSSAMENRNYFEGLKDNHATKASSHYVIGLEGEIVQCIPLDEMSYASNNRNTDTISIECCHPKADGKFTEATYQSLVKLLRWLCFIYDLPERDIIRHYDVTGKPCPLYYVEHEDAWKQLLDDVRGQR